ncbi:transcription factor FAMA isoform X2 [Jatropha curcas]|uniref:transcription factor FAMA isoform X2 n=1 Tax=Jatropha curcas TaxID=180498 RepID=UPI0009D75511|nr:transcription factor FAMA isoform X2 [Jatropha curcas]XP_020534624.1 transcription factor FAMA isoform X2 [Jatropha curcas]
MDKEDSYTVSLPLNLSSFLLATFTGLDYSLDHHHHQEQEHELIKSRIGESSGDNTNGMIDYMLRNPHNHHHQQQISAGFCSSTSLDKLSFADVMQFADFGPKLALNQTKISEEEETGIDPVYFLKFPVLNDKREDQSLMVPQLNGENEERFKGVVNGAENRIGEERIIREEEEARVSDNTSVQLQFVGDQDLQNKNAITEVKNKRKRPRTIKTSEEVESQRMTHIAVERNRRKQMNEHLRVLRSLMPGSYVQRGDQASIIGGAIEFVRELEQLLQCLESQKRRRLYGEASRQMGDNSSSAIQQPQSPFFPPNLPISNDQMKLMEFETGLHEETAENKSCLADVEVKLLGFDAMIKILSRRRPGQLIKTIAALEDLQLNILHTNITTIEQTVLYSFNVKIASESGFTAEDIASSVQQIFSFIHANSSM